MYFKISEISKKIFAAVMLISAVNFILLSSGNLNCLCGKQNEKATEKETCCGCKDEENSIPEEQNICSLSINQGFCECFEGDECVCYYSEYIPLADELNLAIKNKIVNAGQFETEQPVTTFNYNQKYFLKENHIFPPGKIYISVSSLLI